MRICARGKAAGESLRFPGKTATSIPKARRFARWQFPWQPCLVTASYLLAVALCGVALYLRRASLPPLPASEVADDRAALSSAPVRAGSKASLDVCLRQVKVRELFKPSILMPSEGRLGKTTAQELADRLQFLGVVGDAGSLAALVFIPNRGPGTFRVGDRIAEFTLQDVQPDRLVLSLGDEEATLKR